MKSRRPSRDIRSASPLPSGRSAGGTARQWILVRALVGLAVLVGCEELVVNAVPVSTVVVVPGEAELVLGQGMQFRAELYGGEEDVLSGRDVAWRSENPAIVRIDQTGLAFADGAGATEITATAEGQVGRASVVVLDMPRIDLNRSSVAFSVAAGGRAPNPIEIEITNGGAGSLTELSATVTYGEGPAGWLNVALSGPEAPSTMTLTVETGSLMGGTYAATVLVSDPAATNSPAALEVTLQVQQNVPAPPSDLDAATVSASAVVLVWSDNSDNETGFQIHRQAPGEAAVSLLATVDTNVVTYQDEAVAADGRYVYQVRACNSAGCSSFSEAISPTTPPVAPSSITAEATSPTTVDVAWVDNSATETSFRIERRTVGGTFAEVGSVGANTTSFGEAGLEPSTSYEYRVRACNDGGCSAYNGPVSVSTSAGMPDPPAAPASLGATVVSSTRVDLTWADVATESGYTVERSSDAGATYTELATPAADATSYSDAAAAEATDYTYRVSACNAGGCASSTVTASTPLAPPTGLSASAVSDTRIDLSWSDQSSAESEYRIERRVSGGTFAEVAIKAANSTSHEDTGLAPSTTYEYRVRACDAGDCSAYSAEASATTDVVPPPAAPGSLVATVISPTQVDLTWTDVATESGYTVERSSEAGTSYAEIATLAADVTSYSDAAAAEATEYTYRVSACNSAGCASSTVTASTPLAPPSGLAASAVSDTQIDLSWVDQSSAESEYRIERRVSGGTFSQIAVKAANSTSHEDTGLAPSTTYEYQVLACDAAGPTADCSAYSALASATTEAEVITPPAAPGSLVATVISPTQVDLAWTDVATESEYTVERSSAAGASYAEIATLAADVTIYSDAAAAEATDYTYRVSACNAGGCASSTVTASTPLAPPTGLSASAVSDTRIDLSWSDQSGAESEYRIERRVSGGAFAEVAVTAAGSTGYEDTGLESSTTYEYRVRACDAGDCSAYSAEASATTDVVPPPAAPGSLGATVISPTRVDLTWADVATESNYTVERSSAGASYTEIATLAADVTSYSDAAAAEATDYTYRVSACNAGGCSSSTVTASTPLAPPTGLSASAVSDTRIDLSWSDQSSAESEYRVERRVSGGTFADVAVTAAGSTGYEDTGLESSTTYEYRVRACDGAAPAGDCSAYSNLASATTDVIPPPAAPGSLGATVVSATRVDLTWADVATESGYTVERSSDAGTSYMEIATLAADVTSYSDAAAAEATDYTYRVSACNAGGCASSTVTASTPLAPPTGLSASAVSDTRIDLSWSDQSSAESEYRIERRMSGGAFAEVALTAAGITGYKDNGLESSTTYEYRVRACDAGDCSAYSNLASATTDVIPPPAAPGSLGATVVSATRVDLTWADVATESGYTVERSSDAGPATRRSPRSRPTSRATPTPRPRRPPTTPTASRPATPAGARPAP